MLDCFSNILMNKNDAHVFERDFNEDIGVSLPIEIEVRRNGNRSILPVVSEDTSTGGERSWEEDNNVEDVYEYMNEEHFNTTTIFEALCSSTIAGINTSPPVIIASEHLKPSTEMYLRELVDLAVDGSVLGGQIYQPNMIHLFDRKTFKDLSWINKLPMVTTLLLSPFLEIESSKEHQADLLEEFRKIVDFIEEFLDKANAKIHQSVDEFVRFEFYFSDDFQSPRSDLKYPWIDFFEVLGVVQSSSFLIDWVKEKMKRLECLQEIRRSWNNLSTKDQLPRFDIYTPEMKTYVVLNAELLTAVVSETQRKGCITKRIEDLIVSMGGYAISKSNFVQLCFCRTA